MDACAPGLTNYDTGLANAYVHVKMDPSKITGYPKEVADKVLNLTAELTAKGIPEASDLLRKIRK